MIHGPSYYCILLYPQVDDISVKINETLSPMTERASNFFKPLGAAVSFAISMKGSLPIRNDCIADD